MTDDLQKFLDELRSRISISEIIGEKVKLTKRGHEYLGLCPFHHEKTPSFTINESKGFYHCFGCGEHGDIIKFLMQSEGLPFIEAVKKLASRVSLSVPAFSAESQEANLKRKSLYEIMDMASSVFEKNLYMPIGNSGLQYLRNKRGLTDEVIKKFHLGYASDNNSLKAYMESKSVSEATMLDLGLIVKPENQNRSSYDFFRDRVIIPIMDKQNNVIAFGGRILDNGQPKYLNSPETPIFNKRRILYNMNNAKDAAYQHKRLIICEGYMDVIALDCFGFSYAVAPLGTALTEEQILEAWKVCNTPILCFDGDNAGIRAAIRSIDRVLPILKAGYSVNYVFLKDYKDPDELLHAAGPQLFEQYILKSKPLVDILWHKCKMNKNAETPEQKALIEKEVFEQVNKIKDNKIRAYYTQEMKKRIYYAYGRGSLSIEEDNNIKQSKNILLSKISKSNKLTFQAHNFVKKPPLTDLILRKVIAGMILYPELIKNYENRLLGFEIADSDVAKILTEILEIYQNENISDSDILLDRLKLNYSAEINKLWEFDMYKAQKTPLYELKKEIDVCLTEIQIKQIEKEIKECIELMEKSTDNSNNLYKRYQQLQAERNNLIQESNMN